MGPRSSLLVVLAIFTAVSILACHTQNPAAPSCTVTLDPSSLAFTSAGGSGVVAVSTSMPQCSWTTSASTSWISVVSGVSGTGPGSVKYAVAANTGPQSRSGALTIGGVTHNVTQEGQSTCAFDVQPTSAAYDSAGGQGTLTVLTTTGCAWTATTSDVWLTIVSGASGQGPGVVTYAIAAQPAAAARTGVIHVAGMDVQVTQSAAGCSSVVSPQSATFGPDGGQSSISVSAPAGCGWTATASDAWLTIVAGASGQGNGTVQYTVARQTTDDVRTATIHVAGVDVKVVQSGDLTMCQYSVSPVAFSPCMPASTMTTAITTGASCPWTAAAGVSWITIAVGSSGTGSGMISFSTSDNYDAPRSGVVMVRWPTPTAGQNVQVAQAGCTYAVSQNALFFAAAGGSGSFDVYQSSNPYTCGGPTQDACVWSATSDAPWITIVTPAGSTKGDNPVHFTIATNTTGATRAGTIHVKDQVVTVTQSGS